MGARFYDALAPGGMVASIGATVVARGMILVAGMAMTILVARQLGPTGRGEYAVAFALAGIGVQLANLGVHTSTSWRVARSPGLLGPLLANGLVLAAVLGTGTALLMGVIIALLPQAPSLSPAIVVIALVSIPIALAYLIEQNLLLGLKRIKAYNGLEVGNRGLAFLVVLLAAASGMLSPELALGAGVVAVATVAIVATIVLARSSERAIRGHLPLVRELGGYGLRAYVAALFVFLLLRLDLLLVERLMDSRAAGHYSVAISIVEVVAIPAVVTATILFPRLSEMSDRHSRIRLASGTTVAAGTTTALLGCLVAVFLRPLVGVVFGAPYLPAVEPALWLLPGTVAYAIYVVIAGYYYAVGTPLVAMIAPISGLIANVVLDFVLIPSHGLVGAAVASSVAYGVMMVVIGAAFLARRAS